MESDMDKPEERKRKREVRREAEAYGSKAPGETVKVDGKDVMMPHGWRHEELQVGVLGNGDVEKVPVFVSPEDIVCFGVEMMEGCESARRKKALNFERSLDVLKADAMKLAKWPILGEVSDKGMGRDSVVVYRRGMALRLKAQQQLAANDGGVAS